MDHQRAVLAALDHQRARAHLEDVSCGAQKIVLAGELARLVVVDHEDLRVLERLAKLGGGALDPVIHRVEPDDFRLALHLLEDGALQRGVDIAKENARGIEIGIREASA